MGCFRKFGEPFASPASEVGHQRVGPEVNLWLEQDPPPAGGPSPAKASVDVGAGVRRGAGVRHRWPRKHEELSIDDLSDHRLGHSLEVGKGRR